MTGTDGSHIGLTLTISGILPLTLSISTALLTKFIRSHRSTQKSKKGPFQTHYYDCRLKGRPPGTPQNQDPNKKKRKRAARERDLCDMKIKVVETIVEDGSGVGKTFTIERVRKEGLPQRARIGDPADVGGEGSAADGQVLEQQLEDVMGLGMGDELQLNDPGAGDGPHSLGILAPNKAVDMDQYGIPGLLGEVHRHTLEESDRIKKCTVEREGIKRQKEMKKVQVSLTQPLSISSLIIPFFLPTLLHPPLSHVGFSRREWCEPILYCYTRGSALLETTAFIFESRFPKAMPPRTKHNNLCSCDDAVSTNPLWLDSQRSP